VILIDQHDHAVVRFPRSRRASSRSCVAVQDLRAPESRAILRRSEQVARTGRPSHVRAPEGRRGVVLGRERPGPARWGRGAPGPVPWE
jgi:hypothetical protein